MISHGSSSFLICLVCSTSSLVFFYIRQTGTGKSILTKSLAMGTLAVAVVLDGCSSKNQEMAATPVAQHGCSQHYARTCCTTCRSSTPHAAAEAVKSAGWRWDGNVQAIPGKDAIVEEDGTSACVCQALTVMLPQNLKRLTHLERRQYHFPHL